MFYANHLSSEDMVFILPSLRNEIARLESDTCSWKPAPAFAAALRHAGHTLYDALLNFDIGFHVDLLSPPLLGSTTTKHPRATNPQPGSEGWTTNAPHPTFSSTAAARIPESSAAAAGHASTRVYSEL